MTSLDTYIESRFKNVVMKKIYVSQVEFDALKAWIKYNLSDYTEHYGCYEQHMGRYPKGERDFYVATNRIVVEYSRHCFRNCYEKFSIYYLLKYEILVKE